MINAYKEYWHNMTVMNASAKRGQYWWPQVINYLVLAIYSVVTGINRYMKLPQTMVLLLKNGMLLHWLSFC